MNKQRKYGIILLTAVLLIFITACSKNPKEEEKTLLEIVNQKTDKMVYVDIMNGNTGEMRGYANEAELAMISEFMQKAICVRTYTPPCKNWDYRIQIQTEEGTRIGINLAGINSRIDNQCYYIKYPDVSKLIVELRSVAAEPL